ncbi:MAG: efflux RND transporter periplasmic adaptor subunit [Flavobacterium sp.]
MVILRKTVFLSALLLSCLISCKKNTAVQTEAKASVEVTTTLIKEADVQEYLTFNGVAIYQRKENIRSNVTGYISRMNFKIGDKIGRGQSFATVRTKEQDALKAAVKIDSSLRKFINPIGIKSNAAGIISVLNITDNDYVAEGDILATIVQPTSLVVQVNVPFEYKDIVQIGSDCEILLQNGDRILAKISGSLPSIDPIAQSQIYLIALPQQTLPENLNLQVRIIRKEAKNALTIPKNALQTNELLTEYWVFKILKDSIAVKQNVTPLLENDSIIQISGTGLKRNDRIVLEGGYQMQDSTIVSIRRR